MYCSTCGAHVPAGRAHCTTCGSSVAGAANGAQPGYGAQPAYSAQPAYTPAARPGGQVQPALVGHTCPRCGYVGEGVSYFSKGSHIAGLVVLGVVSGAMAGVFAIVYYLSFHNHTICPRCGKDWGHQRDYPRIGSGGVQPAIAASSGRASVANGFSIALFLFAALMMMVAVGAGEVLPAMFGLAAAGGGAGLQTIARKEREARRAALLSNLQMPVLALAAERRGRLTVTETAAALGWPLPRAEKVLNSLEDGLRVNSEVTEEGVIVYEFRELAHGGRKLPPPVA